MLDLTPNRNELDPIEIASRDEIAALQLERLKRTLRRVYDNVPHYWKAFDAAGVHPDSFATLADLAKFPFTAKEDLRANYPFGLFATPASRSCACTPPPAPRASRPSSAIPGATSRCGPRSSPARSAPPAAVPA